MTEHPCVIVGEGPLAISCARALLERGHRILAIVTLDEELRSWADSQAIPTSGEPSALPEVLNGQRPDYLFNIAALRLLSEAVLALPLVEALNYHDGPLPAFAGLFAPNWAILHGATQHGVCWHAMRPSSPEAPAFDSGVIYSEEHFPLEADESAWSLQARCFEAAERTFRTLLDRLDAGGLGAGREQDFSKRSVFTRFERPPHGGALFFAEDTASLHRLVRACDFGPQPNPFLTAKLVVGKSYWVVEGASHAAHAEATQPGTLLAADADGLVVATQDGSIRLARLRTASGALCSADQFLRDSELRLGDVLPAASDLESSSTVIVRGEPNWRQAIRAFPAAIDCGREDLPLQAHEQRLEQSAAVQDWIDVLISVREQLPRAAAAEGLLLKHPGLDEHGVLGSAAVPCVVPLTSSPEQVRTIVEQTVQRGPLARDLDARLSDASAWPQAEPGQARARLACVVCEDPGKETVPDHAEFVLLVRPDGRESRFLTRTTLACEGESVQLTRQPPASPHDLAKTVVSLWNERVRSTPQQPALRCQQRGESFEELNRRVQAFATELLARGVQKEDRVGLALSRSPELLVAMLGCFQVGAAYVPLDPNFPPERLRFIAQDAALSVVVTDETWQAPVPPAQSELRCSDLGMQVDEAALQARQAEMDASTLAYLLYTSGSTGQPKGVEIEHGNLTNFFAAMDEALDQPPSPFLAVSSANFDISVLELIWTLLCGSEVVLYLGEGDQAELPADTHADATHAALDFSLFFWGASGSSTRPDGNSPYDFLLGAARFGDAHGFRAVWTPERHFHDFGGLFPNPHLTSAALATATERIEIRSGSTVAPLHSPVRLAEDWAMIDLLSKGRAGVALASGWAPNDFIILREHYATRKERTFEQIDLLRQLWAGGAIQLENGVGEMVEVRTQPRPIQKELPIWLTAAGSPDTFVEAGRKGCHLLTHLLGQSVPELAEKIRAYRQAWKDAGHAGQGTVSLMLHTFVGRDDAHAREVAREPMKHYLGTAVSLVEQAAWAWPATRQKMEQGEVNFQMADLSQEDQDALLEFAFERYYGSSGLFGGIDRCVEIARDVAQIDVDEIACLIDYGVANGEMLESLPRLAEVLRQVRRPAPRRYDGSILGHLQHSGVRAMQCTPSMAQMMVLDASTREAMSGLAMMLVGGEALPAPLARTLEDAVSGPVVNMYGPTETTIWSSCQPMTQVEERVSIGRPIRNTRMYVLNEQLAPCADGEVGELWIAGEGVARGYWQRPQLTTARFRPDPFVDDSAARMYRTGDLAAWAADGTLDYRGRVDSQVKLRGYRIELGEIEHALTEAPGVHEAAAVVREEASGDVRLIAYYTAADGSALPLEALRAALRTRLPEYMLPQHFEWLAQMPQTPNGKIDRKALPAPSGASKPSPAAKLNGAAVHDAPSATLETVRMIWQEVLGIDSVGLDQNFFDLGGHSLLAVRVQIEMKKRLSCEVSLVDVFAHPTVRGLAQLVSKTDELEDAPGDAQAPQAPSAAAARGAARRQARARLRREPRQR